MDYLWNEWRNNKKNYIERNGWLIELTRKILANNSQYKKN